MVVQSRVAQYVKEAGIKQSFISEKTGLSENVISLIFNGKRKMSADEFAKICKAISKAPNDFMETA